jgi:hypothetical protein
VLLRLFLVSFVLLWPLRSVLYSSLILSVSASTGVTPLVCPCSAILLLGKKKAQFVLRFDHARVRWPLLELSCGAVKDLVPASGNREWQSVSTEKSRLFSSGSMIFLVSEAIF